jgi:LPPG:FO 2-phospho-L-lactate transferase
MKIVALAGGVGGAKLCNGLAQLLPSNNLDIIVNTGDDFEHLGLYISPDLDTVCYTLAGLANTETGWGLSQDSFSALNNIEHLGGPSWFHLGDMDLATHIVRTMRLKEGQSLSHVTRNFCQTWGIRQNIFPMSDCPVHTLVITAEHGELPFQEYFVRLNCEPLVKGFNFSGIVNALPAPGVLESIDQADAIVICPSNPWVSIDPILEVADIRSALFSKLVIAVSPIIRGKAVKGPVAKMYSEMGIQPSSLAVAQHYGSILGGFIIDTEDSNFVPDIPCPTLVTNILMANQDDQERLAQDVLTFIQTL